VALEDLRRTWETLGREDPLWAVLSNPNKRNNRWDPEEFFRTGEADIADLLDDLDRHGLQINRGRCLDFGCGVGRLTQALCGYFERVDGIDIAQSMVDRARQLNRHGERCQYHLNVRNDLALFEDATFDFVYSVIVLQHMAPEYAEAYIGEFVRVLVPAGIAVFQVPSRFIGPQALPEPGHQAELRLAAPGVLPRLAAGSPCVLTIEVKNTSPVQWRSSALLTVGNHWLDDQGRMISFDDGRIAIAGELNPGELSVVELPIRAPMRGGRYTIEVDMVEEGVAWFATKGSPTLAIPVEVDPPPRATVPLRKIRDLTGRVRRRFADAGPQPGPFEMHALPRESVVGAVESGGGEVCAVEECDVSGPGWENYRYFVRRRAR
jgi:SAM-dependent methyltransferase